MGNHITLFDRKDSYGPPRRLPERPCAVIATDIVMSPSIVERLTSANNNARWRYSRCVFSGSA